ncbi:hypothetical protein D3C87_2024250 [compost metagenome]
MQLRYEVFIHQSSVDHCYHIQHRLVGNAAAVDHLRFDLQFRGYLRGDFSATMHEDFGSFELRKGFEKTGTCFGIIDHITADLDYV